MDDIDIGNLLIVKNIQPELSMVLWARVIQPAMRAAYIEGQKSVVMKAPLAARAAAFTDALEAAVLAPSWRDVPVTAELLADVFDAYCGADGHNLVVSVVSGKAKVSA